MSRIIDTHVHFDSKEFVDDIDEVIVRSNLCGVKNFIIPAASIKTFDSALSICMRYDNVYYAVGIHPCHVDEIMDINTFLFKDYIHILKDKIANYKCKAIGECGLDLFRLEDDKDRLIHAQIKCFEWQVELALEFDLPLILHVRDEKGGNSASLKVLEILQKYTYIAKSKYGSKHRLRGVFHCYNACEDLLAMSDTFYYGIGGIVTFKNAQPLQAIIHKIPKNRILLETDAPYLAPIPHRGKRNESSFLTYVVSKLSEILHIDEHEIANMTTKNAQILFNID